MSACPRRDGARRHTRNLRACEAAHNHRAASMLAVSHSIRRRLVVARKQFEICANTLASVVGAVARAAHRVRFAVLSSAICVFGAELVESYRSGGSVTVSPASAASATATARARERCIGATVDVAAASSDERRLACSAASRVLERLGRCSIVLQRPLRIRILDEVRHPHHGGEIFGFFDTAREVVLVTKYDNIPDLVSDTPYVEVRHEEFYKSLIVHEVVHGVMHQNLTHAPTSNASYEYPAYALQLESLPYDERRKLLQATARGSELDGFMFSDLILAFDPFFFAARAYEHFKIASNSCARLLALLQGEAPFIRPSPLS